jgi:CRP/FNR family cyclic AMP-dependent transcriptional regulator
MTHSNNADILRHSPLGRELTDPEIEALAKLIVVRDLKDGEVLLAEGISDSNMHVVVDGAIAVAKPGDGGKWNTLHMLTPGDFVGELSFMDNAPHFAALIASGPTRVFSLSREKFETLIDTHPRAVYKAMCTIMRVVHAIQRRLSMQIVEMQNYFFKVHGRY